MISIPYFQPVSQMILGSPFLRGNIIAALQGVEVIRALLRLIKGKLLHLSQQNGIYSDLRWRHDILICPKD